jgi:hypothetical protein
LVCRRLGWAISQASFLGAPQAGARSMTKPGIDADGVAENEADHFTKCPACSQWLDMLDLAQVVQHIHDSEIEVLSLPLAFGMNTLLIGFGW